MIVYQLYITGKNLYIRLFPEYQKVIYLLSIFLDTELQYLYIMYNSKGSLQLLIISSYRFILSN